MTIRTQQSAAQRALRLGSVLLLGFAALSCGVGYAIAQMSGVWGAALGSGIAGIFFAITATVAVKTSTLGVNTLGAAILGSWLIKIVVLMAALAWLRNQDFYHVGVLFGTLVLTTFGLLIVESFLLTTARVPYVEPE